MPFNYVTPSAKCLQGSSGMRLSSLRQLSGGEREKDEKIISQKKLVLCEFELGDEWVSNALLTCPRVAPHGETLLTSV